MGNSKSKRCLPKVEMAKKTGVLNISDSNLSNKSSLWASDDFLALTGNLKVLDLTGNELTSVPEQITQLAELKTFNCAKCQICSGPDLIILPKLVSLDLSHNQHVLAAQEPEEAQARW